MHRYTVHHARAEFEKLVDNDFAEAARAAVAAGTAEWVRDPEYLGVFGLVRTESNDALVIMYAPAEPGGHWDFECDEGAL